MIETETREEAETEIETGEETVTEIETREEAETEIETREEAEIEAETRVEVEIEILQDRNQIIEIGSVRVVEIQTFHSEQNATDVVLLKILETLVIDNKAEKKHLERMSQNEQEIGIALAVVNPILQKEVNALIVENQRE